MKYLIAFALAAVALSPATAETLFDIRGDWRINYEETRCNATSMIGETTIGVSYDWTTDNTIVVLTNQNWSGPKQKIRGEFKFSNGNQALLTYGYDLLPDKDPHFVGLKVNKGTELLTVFAVSTTLRTTLPDGTVIADLPLVHVIGPMLALKQCIRERRVADPFVKPMPMINVYESGGFMK